MTSSDRQVENLSGILRYLLRGAINEAVTKARTPSLLSGSVEDINSEELDVAWVRVDDEANSNDPFQTDNIEMPSLLPAQRLGEAYTGEQVRAVFDGSAGASAQQTSVPTHRVFPYGAETGQRIVLDSDTATFYFYDENGDLVETIAPDEWAIGDLTTPGNRLTIDPLGGIRMRDSNNTLVSVLDQNGYTLRDGSSGLVTADLHGGSLTLVDPTGSDNIELVTSGTGTLMTPGYESTPEANPGSSLVIPAASVHSLADHTDLSVGCATAWLAGTSQAATMTPPGGWTERLDAAAQAAHGTLQASIATLSPATGSTATFTSSQTNWQHGLGTHVVVHGEEGVTPAFRSVSTASDVTTAGIFTGTVSKPTGAVQGDVLLAFVSIGVRGGLVPAGWTTPPGFVFLGANWLTVGSGTTQSTLATGVWAKLATGSEPATYQTTINLPSGTKTVYTSMVAVQTPGTIPGGVQIRIAGRPIRRLLAFNELTANDVTLCDFQNIPQSYDNLELVVDSLSVQNGAAAPQRIVLDFNADTANNYFWKYVDTASPGVTIGDGKLNNGRPQLVALNDSNDSPCVLSLNLYSYARPGSSRSGVWHGYWVADVGGLPDNRMNSGFVQWNQTPGINRIRVLKPGGGTPVLFKAGSRAWLYGY